MTIFGIFDLLGGTAVFLSGLRLISDNFTLLLDKKLKSMIRAVTKSKCLGVLTGTFFTTLMQSSVAVNVLAVSLVEGAVINIADACAVIIGTNIGTTFTAQIVSLTFGGGVSVSSIGALVAFIGFVFTEISCKKTLRLGNMLLGFGLTFTGIKLMTSAVETFYDKSWFINFFLIKSPPISLLNGFFITAICQSSSVVTSLLVILSESGVVSISNAIYMILGANVGSCMAVIFASHKMSASARMSAAFNFLFNAVWAVLFFVFMLFFGNAVTNLLLKTSKSAGGAVANFHTLFNVVFGVITIPFLPIVGKLLNGLSKNRTNGGKRCVVLESKT